MPEPVHHPDPSRRLAASHFDLNLKHAHLAGALKRHDAAEPSHERIARSVRAVAEMRDACNEWLLSVESWVDTAKREGGG